VALLRELRDGGGGLRRGSLHLLAAAVMVAPGLMAILVAGCEPPIPEELQPDSVLRERLGLTGDDEVHRVVLVSTDREEARPDSTTVPPGAWVEFVTGDWRIHEVRFEFDSLAPEAADFLRSTGQVASPPLLHLDARFVVSFEEAPVARYPYLVEGNLATGRGVVIVRPRP